jgi:hypothetical protein
VHEPLDNQANLSDEVLAGLATEVARHGSLAEAVLWAPEVLDVVVQDEYTHDVVLRGRDGLVFVYDTT